MKNPGRNDSNPAGPLGRSSAYSPPPKKPVQCSLDDLLAPDRLSRILEIPDRPAIEALQTSGYSGSHFYRISRPAASSQERWIVKITDLRKDWFSFRSQDRWGREAHFVAHSFLPRVRGAFDLPYRAVAIERHRSGLLMDDLGPWLLPDRKESITRQNEHTILDAFARLHALFWQDSELAAIPWLHSSADLLEIMGPRDRPGTLPSGTPAGGIQQASEVGWRHAERLLPSSLREALWQPPEALWRQLGSLPSTLVHGDSKIANLALLPEQRVAAFDWAFVARAPATFDIGWYLAVNASRLAGSKEAVFSHYRDRLEHHLRERLDKGLWRRLEHVAVVAGSMMLLWNKATAVAEARPGADEEWSWWTQRLESWIAD